MEQLSKLEILNETVKFYSEDVTRRSKYNGTCAYNSTYGLQTTHCAVGRCMQQHYREQGLKLPNNYECDIDSFIADLGLVDIDLILDEKYHGHELQFWQELQRLHDLDPHWNDNGLTEVGEIRVKDIKEQFGITE